LAVACCHCDVESDPDQPREMHSADVMGMADDHARAIRGDDPAEFRHRHRQPVLGPQPAAPVAAVAGDIEHREAGGDLVEQDDTGRHGRILIGQVATPLRYA
jgi:hypothetical protein